MKMYKVVPFGAQQISEYDSVKVTKYSVHLENGRAEKRYGEYWYWTEDYNDAVDWLIDHMEWKTINAKENYERYNRLLQEAIIEYPKINLKTNKNE